MTGGKRTACGRNTDRKQGSQEMMKSSNQRGYFPGKTKLVKGAGGPEYRQCRCTEPFLQAPVQTPLEDLLPETQGCVTYTCRRNWLRAKQPVLFSLAQSQGQQRGKNSPHRDKILKHGGRREAAGCAKTAPSSELAPSVALLSLTLIDIKSSSEDSTLIKLTFPHQSS